ncbi:MAG: phosphoheptose isomerase [Sphingomonas sp.]|nr:phosphoheptose isomerase [Sphingomonas sp.]
MAAILLDTHRVAKPWGRHRLWPGFENPAEKDDPIGEVWFQTPQGVSDELLIKYLFTSEKLSVQVHPNDADAQQAGYKRGKDEAWLILDAEPDSTIALGTLEPLSAEQLRTGSLDGSIEHMLDWKPVKAGDYFYSQAGTVHAIGAGITLIEVQQNVDLTYRLYDYGRPRELHLDEGVAVSAAAPFEPLPVPPSPAPNRDLLAQGPKFVLERWSAGDFHARLGADQTAWLVPVTGSGSADDVAFAAGQCLAITGESRITVADGGDVLFAYPGDRLAAID